MSRAAETAVVLEEIALVQRQAGNIAVEVTQWQDITRCTLRFFKRDGEERYSLSLTPGVVEALAEALYAARERL